MFRDICASSLLGSLPCHSRTSAGGGRWTEKGQSIPSRLQRPQPRPSQALRLRLPGRRASRACLQSQPPVSLHSLFLLPRPCPASGFKYPSSNCDRGGNGSWKPGLFPLLPWSAPGCPRAPWPESSVEPPWRPFPSWPPGAGAAQGHACARVRLYTHEPRVRG